MWDLERGEQISTLLTGGVGVKYQDNMIVSGSFDHTIKIWDARTGTPIRSFAGHTNDIWCLEVHGNYIASGSKDTTIRVRRFYFALYTQLTYLSCGICAVGRRCGRTRGTPTRSCRYRWTATRSCPALGTSPFAYAA